MNEDEILIVLYEDGAVRMSRYEPFPTDGLKDFIQKGLKQAFVVPEKTFVYQLSNYFGYAKIPEEWREVKK